MPSNDDTVVVNIRERGARQTAGEVDVVAGALKRMGVGAHTASVASKQLKETGSTLSSPLQKLRGEVGSVAKSFIGMGLAFGSFEGIKKSIGTTDDLVKSTVQLHNQFGLTAESASGLSGVLQTRGISPMALRMGFVTLSKAMVGANQGTTRFRQDFRRLGIDTREVHRALGTQDGLSSVFETVTDRLTRMQGGARKAALGQDLLGRASRGLAPLLQEGALGLRQQLKWANEFGVTLNGKTIKSVEGMAAAQTKAQYAALGLQIQMGQLLAPALTKVNTTFSQVIKSFRDGRPEGNKYARTIYQIGKDLEPVGKDLLLVGKYLKDHPKLLRLAALAFIGYKTKLLSLLAIAPKAYLQGMLTGRAYATGVETGVESERATFTTLGSRIGGWIGPAMAAAAAVYIGKQLYDAVAGSAADLLAAPTQAGIATDTNPAVVGARGWSKYLRRHPSIRRNFYASHPGVRSMENRLIGIDAGGGSSAPGLSARDRRYVSRTERNLTAYLRGIGDPMFTPRSTGALRHIVLENHITLKTPDGRVLLREVQRAQADQRARR